MINNPIIYKFFNEFTNHRKKTNKVMVFSSRPFSIIFKDKDHWWGPPAIWKRRPFQTHVEEFSLYVWSSGWQFLRTTMGNPIRTRCLWWIKGCYDLFNHFESYRNTIQSQINSRRGNSERDHQEIINESSLFLGKVFSKQFCFIRFFFLLKIASHFTNWSIYKLLKK